MIPGRLVHRLASHLCEAKALDRVIEPPIADLQHEYSAALGRTSTERIGILFNGYVAILEAIAMSALDTCSGTDDERHVLTRTFLWSLGMTMSAVVVLILLTVAALPGVPAFFVATIVPLMVPIAVAVGLSLGIAFGLTGRILTRHMKAVVVLAATISIVFSLGATVWSTSIPLMSQPFRQSIAKALGGPANVARGAHEISLSEARQQRHLAPGGDLMGMPRRLAWLYHFRLALLLAPLLLAVFALALIDRGASRPAVMSIGLAYLALIVVGEALVYRGLPPVVGAWLANIVFALAIAGLLVRPRHRALRGARVSVV
jgi:hypothetical protein